MPIGQGGNTLENARDVVSYLKLHPETLTKKKLAVLSPKFQYERAKEMFEKEQYFNDNGIEVNWIIVDDVLEGRNSHYEKRTRALHDNPKYKEVLESEKKGLEDLKSGEYKSIQ